MKRSLNFNKIINRLATPISSEEALEDVIPFNWSKEVLDGTKKITVHVKLRWYMQRCQKITLDMNIQEYLKEDKEWMNY